MKQSPDFKLTATCPLYAQPEQYEGLSKLFTKTIQEKWPQFIVTEVPFDSSKVHFTKDSKRTTAMLEATITLPLGYWDRNPDHDFFHVFENLIDSAGARYIRDCMYQSDVERQVIPIYVRIAGPRPTGGTWFFRSSALDKEVSLAGIGFLKLMDDSKRALTGPVPNRYHLIEDFPEVVEGTILCPDNIREISRSFHASKTPDLSQTSKPAYRLTTDLYKTIAAAATAGPVQPKKSFLARLVRACGMSSTPSEQDNKGIAELAKKEFASYLDAKRRSLYLSCNSLQAAHDRVARAHRLESEWRDLYEAAQLATTAEEFAALKAEDSGLDPSCLNCSKYRESHKRHMERCYQASLDRLETTAREVASALEKGHARAFSVAEEKYYKLKQEEMRMSEKLGADSDSDSDCGKSINEKSAATEV